MVELMYCFIGCEDNASTWYLNGFPDGGNLGSQQYNVGEKPTVILLLLLLLLLIHTFSVLSLQLKKLRRRNKSAIDLSNANPACGHKEVRRSTGHIMVTTRYSNQQGSKSPQKVMRLCKQRHRPISKRRIKPPYSISRATSIDSECCRLPTTSVLSKKPGKYAPSSSFSRPHIVQK